MKKCPFCAEEIQDEAIICRYCGKNLPKPIIPVQPSKFNIKEVDKSSLLLIFLVLLLFFLIAMFLALPKKHVEEIYGYSVFHVEHSSVHCIQKSD